MNDTLRLTIEISTNTLFIPGSKVALQWHNVVSLQSANEDGTGIVKVSMVDGSEHFVRESLDEIEQMLIRLGASNL